MTPNIVIKNIENKIIWENFLLDQKDPPFLQSWNTANQYEAMGESSLKLGIFDNNNLVGICLIIKTRAKRGDYLYAPYGPVFQTWKKEYFVALKNYLQQWGRENGFDFIRLSPFVEKDGPEAQIFKDCGFKTSPIHMLAEVLWILDLSPDEETLMMNMRKTTRNLIRRAIKDGVEITTSTEEIAVKDFIRLHDETHKRHHFVPYPDTLFYEQVKKFKDDDQVLVLRGKHGNELIASSIVMYYGNHGSYHHGASIRSKVPVAYLLQWEAIREAKSRGCKVYNFWGIEQTEDKKHPFYGITLFKKGFGGEIKYLLPAQDLKISSKYYLTFIIESIRRIRRGFGIKRQL